MFEWHKKEKPFLGIAGFGGGVASKLVSGAFSVASYEIGRSLRFDSSSSAYLSKTFASAGNRKTWTWAGWIKRSKISDSVDTQFFSAGTSGASNLDAIGFTTADTINFYSYGGSFVYRYTTSSVFRDTSAWYHVVAVVDTTNATSTDRVRLYINGVRVTDFTTSTAPSQNADGAHINTTNAHYIGKFIDITRYFNGYLADVHFIDGQALDPTSFGEFDPDTGIWNPIEFTGSYGTNGFHLDFADNSSDAALGYDAAGSNDWTVNNLSIDGAYYYSVSDASGLDQYIPAGWTRTEDPSDVLVDNQTGVLVNQNGVWHFAIKPTSSSITIKWMVYDGSGTYVPTVNLNTSSSFNGTTINPSSTTGSGSSGSPRVGTYSVTAGTTYYVSTFNTGNPAFVMYGTNFTIEPLGTAGPGIDSLRDSPTNGDTANDTGLGGEVPGNYATLNPLFSDLFGSAPTISNGNLDLTQSADRTTFGTIAVSSGKWYWEITIASGTNQLFGITDISKVVIGTTTYNQVGSYYYLPSLSRKYVSGSYSSYGSTVSVGDIVGVALDLDAGTITFYKNGTSLGVMASSLPAATYVPGFGAGNTSTCTHNLNFGQRAFAYQAPSGFKALCTTNLTTPTIADGSAYMDAKLYTGNGSTQTISGLGFSPDLVWQKSRNQGTYRHRLYDTVRGPLNYLNSELTSAESTNQAGTLTSFNSDGFTLGNEFDNKLNDTYVAWTWEAGHPDTAATGSVRFDGAGDYLSLADSADFDFGTGDFTVECWIYTASNAGQILMGYSPINEFNFTSGSLYFGRSGTFSNSLGATVSLNQWIHVAVVRSGSTVTGYVNGVAGTSPYNIGTNSVAFTTGTGTLIGRNHISAGTAQYFNGFISNFHVVKGTALYTSNFTPPTAELTAVANTKLLCCQSTTSATTAAVSPNTITANGNAAATTYNPLDAFSVNGTGYSTTSAASITEGTIPLTGASVNRSAGSSIVTYTGTGANATVGHGLNAALGFIIIKNRDTSLSDAWRVWHSSLAANERLVLSGTNAVGSSATLWQNTRPSSTLFYLDNDARYNTIGDSHVAYCFAPIEGYSAFGSYTGSGGADGPFVYTGFRTRWLMIKNISSIGGIQNYASWLILDTQRDSYNVSRNTLWANMSAAEDLRGDGSTAVGSNCDIDICSNGFKIRTGSVETNGSGNTMIWAAFAENPFSLARAR